MLNLTIIPYVFCILFVAIFVVPMVYDALCWSLLRVLNYNIIVFCVLLTLLSIGIYYLFYEQIPFRS